MTSVEIFKWFTGNISDARWCLYWNDFEILPKCKTLILIIKVVVLEGIVVLIKRFLFTLSLQLHVKFIKDPQKCLCLHLVLLSHFFFFLLNKESITKICLCENKIYCAVYIIKYNYFYFYKLLLILKNYALFDRKLFLKFI